MQYINNEKLAGILEEYRYEFAQQRGIVPSCFEQMFALHNEIIKSFLDSQAGAHLVKELLLAHEFHIRGN